MSNRSRKVRSDKKIRVNPPLDEETHDLLRRLALACDLPKTALAEQILSVALRTSDFVRYIQDINDVKKYRVAVIETDNQVTYIEMVD